MNITIITTSYPITNNGSEAAGSFVSDFVKILSDHVNVTVIAPGETNKIWLNTDGIRIHTYFAPKRPLSILKPYIPKDFISTACTLRNASKALSNSMDQNIPDHIFALWVLPSGFLAMQAAKRYKIPFSTWALGSDIWTLGKIPFVKSILQKVLRTSQINFADGFLLKKDVEKLSRTSCHFLPSTRSFAIQSHKVLATSPPYNLAFLGRWHPNKGVDLLCDSLLSLDDVTWKQIKEVRICGGGPLEPLVKKQVYRMKMKGLPVSLGGFLSKSKAEDLLEWADFVLIPSRIESTPVIFSDSMKARCPVICTPVGDLPWLITNYNVGILSKDVSVSAFSAVIDQVTNKCPNDFKNALENAVQGFDLKRITSTFINFVK